MAMETIQLEGLADAQRALRQVAPTGPAAKQMNQAIVDKLLVPPSKSNAPKRSGRLAESIRSDATSTYGYILAGLRGPVEYAGVIHFGFSTRGLGRAAKGATLKARRESLRTALATDQARNSSGSLTTRATNKAVRLSVGSAKTGRNAVRGGPIKPQPFIYQAIDSRQQAVFEEYDRQIEQRARIEGLL